MDQKLIDKFIERAADAGIYEMLLKRWVELYDVVEEWITECFTKKDLDALYEVTKEQLDYHKENK